MNLPWMFRFGREKAESDKKKTPPMNLTDAQRSEMDELSVEWMTLNGQQITAARVSQMLEAAEGGNAQEQASLLQFMLDKEPIIAAHMQTRVLAVLGCGWCIESRASEEDRRAEEAEDMLKKAGVHDLMRHLLDAIPTGYAGSQIEWDNSQKGGTGITGFRHVLPSNWLFDLGGNPGLYTTGGEKSLASYHPNQFVFHIHKMKPGLPTKGGLLRTLVWMWLFKRNAWRDRARFIEKFGIPLMVAKISQEDFKNDERCNRMLTMLRDIGRLGASLITEGSEITNVTPTGQSSNADYHQFCKDIDEIFALLILGQTATSGGQPGRLGNSTEQENVRLDILESDCKNLMETVNRQIVNPLELFKYGTDGELCFKLEYEPEEDLQKKATLVETLYKAGRKAKKEWVEKTFDIPMDDVPDPVVPTLPPVKPPKAALMDFADSPSANFAGREEFVTRLTENTLGKLFKSSEAMAEFYRPLHKEIRRVYADIDPDDPELIAKFADASKKLFEKYPSVFHDMDSTQFEDVMRGSMLAALVKGNAFFA